MTHKIETKIKFGFIGCGLIGNKRAKFLKNSSIIGCFDKDQNKAKLFSKKFNCENFHNYNKLIKKCDAIIICTPHKYLDKYALISLKFNKNIFIEKPAGTSLNKIKKLINKSKNKNIKIQVGFNHRYHPSIIKALDLIKKNKIGNLMYVRSRYGHGARKDYHKEWRMDKKISGGGELIDQGSHIIDLSRIFLGEFVKINSTLKSFFWKTKVEDNAFLTLITKDKKVAFLHASCTEWKNKFSFEIFGKTGKIEINGLGGSYGKEKLYFYKMSKKFGKPKLKVYHFNSKIDLSWKKELFDFIKAINLKKKVKCGLNDAYKNMEIIESSYKNINQI